MKNILAIFFVALPLAILTGIVYEQISRTNAKSLYKPKGSLVNIGSRLIHLDCRGVGSPTIILESGLDTQGSLSWSAVHDELASVTRTCTYDRAGIMWSDKRPSSANMLESTSADLNKALQVSNIEPPYILVGHSYGGPYITKYTELYPRKVKGIVFVDSPHPEQMELVQDIEPSISEKIQKTINTFLNPLCDTVGITRLINNSNNFVFPNQPKSDSAAVTAFYPTSSEALRQEIENYSNGLEQISHYRDFGDRPIYVLASFVDYRTMSDTQLIGAGIRRDLVDAVMEQDAYMYNDQVSWSTNGKLKILTETSHYIQFERPDEVIKAIKWVIEKTN